MKINLGFVKVVIGLGWDINKYFGGYDFDLDVLVFLVDVYDNCVNDFDFVFYNNFEYLSGGVIYMGDNCMGEGDGDDEQIIVDFLKIFVYIEKIGIIVIIYDVEVCS